MNTTEIGHRIREYRNQKGYSQEWMSQKLNISQASYNRIENGLIEKVNPGVYTTIAQILEVDISRLLFPECHQTFFNCNQSGNIHAIHNHQTDTLEFLKIIQSQMETLQKQISLLNALLQGI